MSQNVRMAEVQAHCDDKLARDRGPVLLLGVSTHGTADRYK